MPRCDIARCHPLSHDHSAVRLCVQLTSARRATWAAPWRAPPLPLPRLRSHRGCNSQGRAGQLPCAPAPSVTLLEGRACAPQGLQVAAKRQRICDGFWPFRCCDEAAVFEVATDGVVVQPETEKEVNTSDGVPVPNVAQLEKRALLTSGIGCCSA